VSQAGGVLLVETVRAAGLERALSQALGPWRLPGARHDPAKVLLDLAVAVTLGGDCLADIAVVRAEPAVFGQVASDATVSRTIAALAWDTRRADQVLAAVEDARAAARARVWRLAERRAPDHDVAVTRDPHTGKRRQASGSGYATRDEAQEALNGYLAAQQTGTWRTTSA
jgi:hypothetical protein